MISPAGDVVGFGRALRALGLPIGNDQLETFARALELISVIDRTALYLAARATLVVRHEDQPVFDEEFARWFGIAVKRPAKMPHAPRHDMGFVKTALGSYMAQRAAESDKQVDLPDAKAASHLELLQRKSFAVLTEAERAAISRMLRTLRFQVAQRRSLRKVRARRGREIDLAQAVKRSARHGGSLLVLPRRANKLVRRPLVVLADISGSMELYTRLVLQFLHTLSAQHGATEVFVFGTRLTRITPQLALRDLDAALDRAAFEIADYAGGTRIGECFREFERTYARRVVRRGAVVLVICDGLDTGAAQVLGEQVRKIQSRAHRLIWLNPLLGPGYQPLAEGMAAALPHVDDFLSARDLGSLEALARHLGSIPRRRSRMRGARQFQGANVR